MTHFSLVLIFLISCAWLSRNVFRSYFSPFYHIPIAHFSAPYSRLWILWVRWKGQENKMRLAAHERLGPIVRIGPQELSINSIEDGVRIVYDGMFEKSKWYTNAFRNYNSQYMFNTLQNKPHTERKRLLTSMYSKSHIQSSQELGTITETLILDRFRSKLQLWAETGVPVEALDENKACFMDMMTAYLFGAKHGTDFIRDLETRHVYFQTFKERSHGFFWRSEFLEMTEWLRWFGLGFVFSRSYKAKSVIENWCSAMCRAVHDTSINRPAVSSDLNHCVYTRLRCGLESLSLDRNELDASLAGEMLDHIIAGFDMSGPIVTYLMQEISQRLPMQHELRKELAALLSHDSMTSSPQLIDRLPLLDAVLMETLRIYDLSLGPKPRYTPINGARIGSFAAIPAGTIVSASGYSLHRNPAVFPSPELWKPERWLDAEVKSKAEMMKWFWAFGSGSRMCIGFHFAIRSMSFPQIWAARFPASKEQNEMLIVLAMKCLIATIYIEFETSLVGNGHLLQTGAEATRLVDNRLLLKFQRADQSKRKST